jgi:thiamine pyrophosphate-dependent acetolactate synthase large subunit-like protein
MFGLMGDQNMLYLTDFIRDQGGRFVSAVAEGGAVGMADGYHRSTGILGVATVTHGPGITNTVTALTEAVRARSCVLLLTGDTPPQRSYAQHIDLNAVVAPTGADYVRVLKPQHVVDDVAMAIGRIMTSRKPLVLDLPIELIQSEIDYRLSRKTTFQRQAIAADEDILDKALGVAATASKPVVVAGRGAVLSGARDALVDLADQLGAPLATTLLARELFRHDPNNLGIMGTLSHPLATEVLTDADCIIAFGATMNDFTTANGSLVRGKPVIQCDIDIETFTRGRPPLVPVLGDALTVALRMSQALKSVGHAPSSFCSDEIRAGLRRRESESQNPASSDSVGFRDALIGLDCALPPDRLVVTDVGRFLGTAWRHLNVSRPENFVHTTNFGSIGLGTAAAVGSAAGNPERLTVCVVGDGGGMMGLIEFNTAVRYQLPLVLVVLDDGAYGAEYVKLQQLGVDPSFALTNWPDFPSVAVALGGCGMRVQTRNDLADAVSMVEAERFPLLIAVESDPSSVTDGFN